MKIRLWKGYHSPQLARLIAKSWNEDALFISCPPLLQDMSFVRALPKGTLEFHGDWRDHERRTLLQAPRLLDLRSMRAPVLGVFTSGTLSDTPRLVLYSKPGVLASLNAIFALFEGSRIQHLFCYPQAFHTFGLTLGYLAAHVKNWQLHTPEGKYGAHAHAQRVALREGGVLTLGTPTHFYDLLEFCGRRRLTLAPSYSCIMGGASVARALWLRVREELGIEAPSIGYGCTEAAPGITHLPPGQVPVEDDEIGYPLGSIHSEILGEEGVSIQGGSLCLSLIQNGKIEFPQKLRIRDHIEVAKTGVWLYRGRLDLSINRGGAKFSLEAIEKTLHDRLGLSALACSLRDARLGEDLGLVIRTGDRARCNEILRDAQSVLKDVYALRLQADRTRFLDELPLNECSKLDRKSLWTLFADGATLPL